MKKEINVPVLQADIPTSNGNVYPRIAIESAIERWRVKSNKMPVSIGVDDNFIRTGLDITKIAGVVDSLTVDDNGTVIAKMTMLSTPAAEILDATDNAEFVMCSVGKTRRDGEVNIVEEIEFSYVAMTPNSAIVYPGKSD